MLQLKNIKKTYVTGGEKTQALKGINLEFRESEFVSILGPSGCGKTTMLNIIGGLDQYTSGDLLIDGKSTKEFVDSDWDAYRNAEIGFVFQSYNLISHLSILDNVAIALSLSGINSEERIKRAKKALTDVGIEKHINKKPNQLSGGQMQRVAIARALVNNPSIVLADEPTGALDSNTSVQIMEILKKISANKLVIMVTHNPELANKYSDRIVRMIDGEVMEDSCPVKEKLATEKGEKLKNKKTKMSFWTALKSSFKNLMTKKGRTIITSIAGSIGIIGVALVLAVSSGMTNYTDAMQRDALAGFPISINQTVQLEVSRPRDELTNNSVGAFPNDNLFYSYDKSATKVHANKINDDYLNYIEAMDKSLYSSISYTKSVAKNVVAKTGENTYKLAQTESTGGGIMGLGATSFFNEMPNSREFIESQYDVLAGNYPTKHNNLALIVDKNNFIDSNLLSSFGIDVAEKYTINDLLGKSFKVIANDDFYVRTSGHFVAGTDYETMYSSSDSMEITISAIMRVKESSSIEFLPTGIAYTTKLTDMILDSAKNSEIVQSQTANQNVNVLTGTPFIPNSQITYQNVMQKIGGSTTPSSIQIYPSSFESKDAIKSHLDSYNIGKSEADQMFYTDIADNIGGIISSMINTISIILVAFAAISLVVSSVMIGIITYVSVVERTKEIGILRAIGARKKDVSRIFNAEALIIGFAAGLFGVIVTYLLCIPATIIVSNIIGTAFTVLLPIPSAIVLVVLSMGLTFVAGLFPSRIAAKKDPVVALRTE